MRKFDYSFLKDGLLPASLVAAAAGISSLKTHTRVFLLSWKRSPGCSQSRAPTRLRAS